MFSSVQANPAPSVASRLCYELDYKPSGVLLSYKLVCGVAEEPDISALCIFFCAYAEIVALFVAMGIAGGALLIAIIVVLVFVGRKICCAKMVNKTSMWVADGETVLVGDDQF